MHSQRFPPPIIPAKLSTRDGALYSDRFGDIYHSVQGGVEEARHVFLSGNDLPARWQDQDRFTIVETGFGCGLNFLATWDALNQSQSGTRLDFVSVEKHPFDRESLAQVLRVWPQFEVLTRKLLDVYPVLVPGFHRLHLEPRVTLTLLLGDAKEQLGELDARADAFFLDGFSPSCNPDMWSAEVFGEIGRLAAPGATVATYSVAGPVRRALIGAGFSVEKRTGFARKREMLHGQFSGTSEKTKGQPKVIVVGAGIAGTTCAFALTRRGIAVELIESAAHAGTATSSNPVALVRPFLDLDDGIRSRFGWAAFAYAVQYYRTLDRQTAFGWNESGVLQLARDHDHFGRLTRALQLRAYPHDLARLVDADEGGRLCGAQVDESGVWFPSAGYLDSRRLCDVIVREGSPSMKWIPGAPVARIERVDDCWEVRDAGEQMLATGPRVILANGNQAQSLVAGHALHLRPVRGQVTTIPAVSPELRAPVCRDGYVTPIVGGAHYVGGTFDESLSDAIVTEQDNDANVLRAAGILPGIFENVSGAFQSDWAGLRCVSRDRVPVVGKIVEGLHASLGMGSRGFNWAPLAGELLASALAGDSCPVERSIAKGILPGRFLVRDKGR